MDSQNGNAGYVYLLVAADNDRLIKIGRTKRHPAFRKRELEATYKCKWKISSYYWFLDCNRAERVIHKIMRRQPYLNRAELYSCDVSDAERVIMMVRTAMKEKPSN